MRKKYLLFIAALLVVVVVISVVKLHTPTTPKLATSLGQSTPNSSAGGTNKPPTAAFNKQAYSTNDPASLWVIVNKQHPLNPKNYAPADLVVPAIPLRSSPSSGEMHVRQATGQALENMIADANQQGIHLMLASGYRSYSLQVSVYNNEVAAYGQARADSESARPGYSEHQTGLAADLEDASRKCEVTDCFANLPEGKWLADNAYKYGFILRYPADKVSVTGYRYEPWHVRYVGTDLSYELQKQKIETLEEFFGISGGANYN